MEPRNVYNYVINLTHLKHSVQIYGRWDLWDKNEMPKHEKDDEAAATAVVVYNFRIKNVGLDFVFFHPSREGRRNLITSLFK